MNLRFFNNFRGHTHYSLLQAVGSPERIVEQYRRYGYKSATITDTCTMGGTYEFWRDAKKANLKPILGCEFNFVEDCNASYGTIPHCHSKVLVLAMNAAGWLNLKKLQAWSWTKGLLREPRIDLIALEKYSEGLVVLSGFQDGVIGRIFFSKHEYYGNYDDTNKYSCIKRQLKKFKDIFGDRFFIETRLGATRFLHRYNLTLSKELNIPMLLTFENRYVKEEDFKLHRILQAVRQKKLLNEVKADPFVSHIYRRKDLKRLLEKSNDKSLYRAAKNAIQLAKRFEVYDLTPKSSSIPKFCDNSDKKFEQLCEEGYRKKIAESKQKYYQELTEKQLSRYRKRFEYEMSVIKKLKFADYFLIVWDIAQFARKQEIPFNTRGSVCGSLVAFCLGISWIDSIRFDCSFERFLTEDRLTMPDVDMDFGRNRRDEIVTYLVEKYQEKCVAHICNYTGYKPRRAIKDLARIYNYGYGESDAVTKKIENTVETWEEIPELPEIQEYFEKYKPVAKYGKKLIGNICVLGVHASGVIITPNNMLNWTPYGYTGDYNFEKDVDKITEWDMYGLEELNILKMDVLGLNNLDIVQHCIETIRKSGNIEFHDFDSLYEHVLNNLDDKEVYEMCGKGDLVGTFQMGTSDGMRQLITDMKPDCIDDIIASVALYRTAVLKAGMHTEYVKRKHGEAFDYIHPKLEPILNKSKGVLLFQEQVSAAAVELAGFTPTESDHFRKGIKLKDKAKFRVWKNKFIDGCIANKIEKKTAKDIWDWMYNFSGYGFNRCLSPDMTVQLKNGKYKTLEQIRVGDKIKSYDGKKFVFDKIVNKIWRGKQEVYEVSLANGNSIRCTLNHKFLTSHGMLPLNIILKNRYKIICDS